MKKIFVLLVSMSFYFCMPLLAADAPVVADTQATLPPPEKDKAQIIFLKPVPWPQGDLEVQLFEIKGDQREFLGVMGTKTKMIVNVDPGKHLFMSTMYRYSHFMDADLVAGQRYYVLVRFIYARGFQLRPIKHDGPADFSPKNAMFNGWIAETALIQKTPAMERFHKKNKKKVQSSQIKYWKEWLGKTPEQRAELTLNKEDFIN